MKRTSIVAPLLLIGIGVLFLARNMYPDLPLIDYLASYWPFLLILWGVLRLAEILFWAATEKELPARGMSGGEWILVVFLCLFGAQRPRRSRLRYLVAAQRHHHGRHRYVRRELRVSDRRAKSRPRRRRASSSKVFAATPASPAPMPRR